MTSFSRRCTGNSQRRSENCCGLLCGARTPDRKWRVNTNDDDFTTPAFTSLDASVAFSLGRWIPTGKPRLSIQVNNLTNGRRIFPSGYSYQYFNRDAEGADTPAGTSYYFPMATRNAVVTLDFRL